MAANDVRCRLTSGNENRLKCKRNGGYMWDRPVIFLKIVRAKLPGALMFFRHCRNDRPAPAVEAGLSAPRVRTSRAIVLFLCQALLALPLPALSATNDELDYRFERMWPQLGPESYFEAVDVAVGPEQRVYLADVRNDQVMVFLQNGTFVTAWGKEGGGEGEFIDPQGIAVDQEGRVYVSDTGNHRIQVFDASGAFLRSWGSEGGSAEHFNEPKGIDVGLDGTVYVADYGNNRIQRFNRKGGFLDQFDDMGWPTDVEVDDSSGYFYILNEGFGVRVLDSRGSLLRSFAAQDGLSGFGPYLALGEQEVLYISGGIMGGLAIYDLHGSHISSQWDVWNKDAFGVEVSDSGRLLVAAFESIYVFSEEGERISVWGSEGTDAGFFDRPLEVEVAENGAVHVLDFTNRRMQIFSATGRHIDTWELEQGTPFDFAFDGMGDVFAVLYDQVEVFSSDGRYIRSLDPASVTALSSIAFDARQRIYLFGCAEGGMVYVMDSTGDLLNSWGTPETKNYYCHYGGEIAISPADQIYVAPYDQPEESPPLVFVYNITGELIAKWEIGERPLGDLGDIEISKEGRIFVSFDAGVVKVYDADRSYLTEFGSSGAGPGLFGRPMGLAVSSSGSVYVTDTEINRIQTFSPAGRSGPLDVWARTPRALIVGGRTAAGDVLDYDTYAITLRHAQYALTAQGYKDEDTREDELRMLWNGPPIADASGSFLTTDTVTSADFTAASELTRWVQSGERLVLYLVGHGEDGLFYLDTEQRDVLTAEELDRWLGLVQPELSGDITVVLEACYSGSFLPVIAAPGRTVLTSADADERAVFINHGKVSYSYNFWSEINMGAPIKDAHETASRALDMHRGPPQTPQLEADGDGKPNDKDDLARVEGLCLGVYPDPETLELERDCIRHASVAPLIVATAPDKHLDGQEEAGLWLELAAPEAASVIDAWAVITRPDFTADANQSFDSLPVVRLAPDPGLAGQRWTGRYAPGEFGVDGQFQRGFDATGEYGITYYARTRARTSDPAFGEVVQWGGADGGGKGPAYDPAQGNLTLDALQAGAKTYQAVLTQVDGGGDRFKLDTLKPTQLSANATASWDNRTKTVEIPRLTVTGEIIPYSGILHLEDWPERIFDLSLEALE